MKARIFGISLMGFLFAAPAAHARPAPNPDPSGTGIAVRVFAQTGAPCGTGVPHCTIVAWTASTSAAACSPTATPPCTFAYNVFRGTVAGGESSIPINSAPVTGLTFIDPVTLTSSPQNFFYTVQAAETVGTVTASSTSSNEVSASFPGTPAAPVASATDH